MRPVIEALLAGLPFGILGFHAHNGSEYIKHKVAKMLHKLAAESTKSRSRQCNHNGLAATKNGGVIRKQLGDSHIPQRFAVEVNTWCPEHLNSNHNFHRPCRFAEDITDQQGTTRKRYPRDRVTTPVEKLASLSEVATCLRPGVTLDTLRSTATALSDTAAAERMNRARQKLFLSINPRSRKAA